MRTLLAIALFLGLLIFMTPEQKTQIAFGNPKLPPSPQMAQKQADEEEEATEEPAQDSQDEPQEPEPQPQSPDIQGIPPDIMNQIPPEILQQIPPGLIQQIMGQIR